MIFQHFIIRFLKISEKTEQEIVPSRLHVKDSLERKNLNVFNATSCLFFMHIQLTISRVGIF